MSDVHVGIDDWLFLIGGNNSVIQHYSNKSPVQIEIDVWKNVITQRISRATALRIEYFNIVAPEKITIYDNKLNNLPILLKYSLGNRLHRGNLLRRGLYKTCINLIPTFRTLRSTEDLYFKMDSHWTFAGCELAYRLICKSCKTVPINDFRLRGYSEEYSPGDLGSKLSTITYELKRFYSIQLDSERVYANSIALNYENRVSASHSGINTVYRNTRSSCDQRKVVLFGDSFSSPSLLLMLAETFKEVHFVWAPAIDWTYIERVMPEILITEIAERFLCQATADDFMVMP